MRQGWCIGLRLPVQLRANNHLHKMAGNSIVVTVLESIFRQLQEIDELYLKQL